MGRWLRVKKIRQSLVVNRADARVSPGSTATMPEDDEVVIIDAKTPQQVKIDERTQRSERRTGGATTEEKDLEAAVKLSIADEKKEWDGLEVD